MSRTSFIPPNHAERLLDAYFGMGFNNGDPVYPKYREYKSIRATGASLFSRKTLAAGAAPTQQKFFNGAPGSYTGNYKADGVLGDFFAILTGIRIKMMPYALHTAIQLAKLAVGGFVTIKVGDTKEIWSKIPLHEVLDGFHFSAWSDSAAAGTTSFLSPGNAAEGNHDAFILVQPDEKFEVILDWNTYFDTVTVAMDLDCVIDYVAKCKN
jgi:hypothetical protein